MGFYTTDLSAVALRAKEEPAASRGVVFEKRAVRLFRGVHCQDSLSSRPNPPASKAFHAVVLRTTAPGVPLYGYRHLSTELGRWPSRDPIEEQGGLNLFCFVQNSPIQSVDPKGLASKCCGASTYDSSKQCCCGGEVLDKANKPTGVKMCCKYVMWSISPAHCWVEYPGGNGSAGFWPGDSLWGPGEVHSPESKYSVDPKKKCIEVELSPCKYKIDDFKSCVRIVAEAEASGELDPGDYIYPIHTCLQWLAYIVYDCKAITKRNDCK